MDEIIIPIEAKDAIENAFDEADGSEEMEYLDALLTVIEYHNRGTVPNDVLSD